MNKGFFTLSDGCNVNSIFTFTTTTKQPKKHKLVDLFMCACCYLEQPLKISERSQQVVSVVKCCSH